MFYFKFFLKLSVLCTLMIVGVPSLANGISGTYVGKSNNGAFLIQIVQTDDGHLTGRYEQIVLYQDGRLDDMNAAITGATDGQTIAVTIKPSEFLASNFVVSGIVQGRELHLSGGGNGHNLTLNMLKSDEADFRAQVTILTNQANQTNETRARQETAKHQAEVEADQLKNLQNLNQDMAAFILKANAALTKFSPIEQRYRAITKHMREELVRERSIHESSQATIDRSQIFIAISQEALEAEQIHVEAQASDQVFNFNSGPLIRESASTIQDCQNVHAGSSNSPKSADREAWNSACLKFNNIVKEFQQRVEALRTAFAQIESVWIEEHRNQDEIVQASRVAAQ